MTKTQKFGVALGVLGLIGLTHIILRFPGIQYSEGTRSGIVTKISEKGLIIKTNEGELSLQRNTNIDGQIVTDVFFFSVEDTDVVNRIREAEKSGKRTTLRYTQYILRGIYRGNTPYNITGVE
jgi:hypothetical protein